MRKISREDRAGIYLTAIVHLAVLIVLLASGLGYSLTRENSFVMDFSHYDELEELQAQAERLQRELEFKQEINRRLEAELSVINPSGSASEVRNVAVDRASLRDDRGTDAEQLYRDAERLQEDLKRGSSANSDIEEDFNIAAVSTESRNEKNEAQSSYTGPSVVAYDLGGRKASSLPIPAYRCMGAGEVKVIITVNPGGDVLTAKIDEENSSDDSCLRSYALRAAKSARFSAKNDAAPKQSGYIIYQFIAQ